MHYGQAGVQQCTYVNIWMEMKNSMLCSSPDDALSVLQSGVLQMAMAIHLSIAFSNQIERLKWLVCILIIFLISHCISISVGRGVASGQGWNILVIIIINIRNWLTTYFGRNSKWLLPCLSHRNKLSVWHNVYVLHLSSRVSEGNKYIK